jgi:putative endonuclease
MCVLKREITLFKTTMFYVYIIYNEQADKFYIGHSVDPCRRLGQHNQNDGDKFTGKYSNWVLCAVFSVGESRSEAMKMEAFIKRQKSKTLIKTLIRPDFVPVGVLAQLVRVPHVRD